MNSPTITDVAARCGVSKMTVSRVVRGVRSVSPATRAKVEAAIAELNYRPNFFSRVLGKQRDKSGNSATQYVSVAFLDSDGFDYGRRMFALLAEEGAVLGHTLKYHVFPSKIEEQRRLSNRLFQQGTRGVILGPSQREVDWSGFDIAQFAVISIGALHHMPAIDSVSQDYFQSMYLATSRCYNDGYRRIGFLIPHINEVRTEHRWLGAYMAFCTKYKTRPRILEYDGTRPPGPEFIRNWISKYELDALVTLWGCLDHNNLIGEKLNVRVVLLSDLLLIDDCAYISIPMGLIARESIRLLNQQLIAQEYGPPQWSRQISIHGQWNETR